MLLKTPSTRLVAVAMLGTLALAAFAPAAHAGHGPGHGRKWKHSYDGGTTRYVYGYRGAPRVYVRERSSCGGSTLAGFVGGLILGTAVAHAAPEPAYAPPPPRDYYYDPYCDVRYGSLDACSAHFSHCHHPRVVRVIEVRTGRCSDSYYYDQGRWLDTGNSDDEDEYGRHDSDRDRGDE